MHSKRSLFIACVFVAHVFGLYPKTGCTLNVINRSEGKKAPILLHNYTSYFDLAIPEEGIIKLRRLEKITLACTGKGNYLTETNSNTTQAACIRGSVLSIFGKEIYFDELHCSKSIRGDVKKSERRCGNNRGHIIEIGYQITKNDWITLIEVCYDEDRGATVYTQHSLYGKEIGYSAQIVNRPGFSTDGLGLNVPASVAYNQKAQKSTFNKFLGSALMAETYINKRSYLAKGHLSPDADFAILTSKRATYYYINTCPQWQIINLGNWKSVEISIRKTAQNYSRTFRITTGTHGILSLPDKNNNPIEIYLDSVHNTLPIPEVIWKLVYQTETELGIAILITNSPFVNKSKLLCENICDRYGWKGKNWNDTTKGFVYCCDLEEFFKVVHTAPVIKVRGVLRGVL